MARADRRAQRPQERQVLVVAVVDRLHVEVHAVEALVHEAPRLRHHALPLREVAELDRSRALPLVSLPQAADPRQHPQLGGDAAGGGEEGAHLLAVVRGEPARRVEGDDVRVDVGDAVRAQPREERLHRRLGLATLQPAVLEPHRVAVVVEGVGGDVAHRGEGEVQEKGRAGGERQRGEPREEGGPLHPLSRRSTTRAAA